MELRCRNKLHALVVDDHIVEIKCRQSFCGAGPDTTVLHRFDVRTGEIVSTDMFKNPPRPSKEVKL